MSENADKRPLKVCSTCKFWSVQYKGFCHRLEQAVGKFWMCADWSAGVAENEVSLPAAPEAAQAGGQ
jgi:hypothetical protein